jgi:hypothetical protein
MINLKMETLLQRTPLVGFSQLVGPCLQSSSQLPRVGWDCKLPEEVCQNCWLPDEKNQATNGNSVSESSFIWLPPLLFYPLVPLSFHENLGISHHPLNPMRVERN